VSYEATTRGRRTCSRCGSNQSRRAGVGRQLLEALTAWASSKGAQEVRLTVTEGNTSAIRLYETVGFETTRDAGPLRAGSSLRKRQTHASVAATALNDGSLWRSDCQRQRRARRVTTSSGYGGNKPNCAIFVTTGAKSIPGTTPTR
jgi:hypothetical protein